MKRLLSRPLARRAIQFSSVALLLAAFLAFCIHNVNKTIDVNKEAIRKQRLELLLQARDKLATIEQEITLLESDLALKRRVYEAYEIDLIKISDIAVRYEKVFGDTMQKTVVTNGTDRPISRTTGYWHLGIKQTMIDGATFFIPKHQPCSFAFDPPLEVKQERSIGMIPWTDYGNFNGTFRGRLVIEKAANERDSKVNPPFPKELIQTAEWQLNEPHSQRESLRNDIQKYSQ